MLVKQAANGLKWSAIERISTQGIQLCIMLYLARVLGPGDFGLIGMLALFIAIAQVFIDSGFSSALIRKSERTAEDYSTTFYFNIIVSAVCYLILYFGAEHISIFYNQPSLKWLLRALSLTFVINTFIIIPKVKLTCDMDFKSQAKISVSSVIIGGVVAVILSANDFGVWTLVVQALVSAFVNAVLLNIKSPGLPSTKFSKKSFNELFGFGSKLLLSGLLDSIYNNLYQIVIGKQFTANYVGQFTQANQLASVPAMTLTNIIQRVTYPVFSQLQHETGSIDKAFYMTLQVSALIVFPFMAGIAMIATPLLTFLLGDKWSFASHLLTILCIGYMLYPIHAINLNLLQVKGRSDLFLKLEIIKKILATAILLVTLPFGISSMCIGIVVHSYLSLLLNCYYTGKITSITRKQQIFGIFPIWIAVLLSTTIAWYSSSGLLVLQVFRIGLMLFIAILIYSIYLYFFHKNTILKIKNSILNG
jgi:O-antigen/teichoic acid export membrane protein